MFLSVALSLKTLSLLPFGRSLFLIGYAVGLKQTLETSAFDNIKNFRL